MKSKLITTLLCAFLGGFGAHRFYLAKYGTGVLWLLTGGICGIGTIVDMVKLALNTTTDAQGQKLQEDCPNWLPWIFIGIYALSLIGAIIAFIGGIAAIVLGLSTSY